MSLEARVGTAAHSASGPLARTIRLPAVPIRTPSSTSRIARHVRNAPGLRISDIDVPPIIVETG
jgi:hypothetical protein